MDLAAHIADIASGFSGKLGIAATNLTTGDRLDLRGEHGFPPASTIKLPILYAIWRGAYEKRWSLDDKLTLTHANVAEGSGVLVDLTPGLRLSVRDVATLMIVVSDNTATNMLLDLCGVHEVNRSMEALGIHGVRLNRKIGVNLETPLGEATPAGMAHLMQLIATHQVLDGCSCVAMIDMLKRQKYKENTNRFIPDSDSEDDVPPVRIASKSGWVRGVRNDVAVIWAPRASYVLSMYSRDCKDRRFYVDNEGSVTLARISAAVYQAWGR